MRASWRPLPTWPYAPSAKASTAFRSSMDVTLRDLATEIERIDGSGVLIGIVAPDSVFSLDGSILPGFAARVTHPGAEVSFTVPDRGRVTFHTDAFSSLIGNLRAIGLGLNALRAVDRYGITTSGEQYAGFLQIGPGGGDPARGAILAQRAGSVAAALKAAHPDQLASHPEQTPRDLADVQAYRATVPGRIRA